MRLPDWIHQSQIFLVAPLNWGLGHATRCIPIIRYLLEINKEVIIASDGSALELLKKEFPDLETFEFPGYDIQYEYSSMVKNILFQSRKIIKAIKNEKKITKEVIDHYMIDTIISDNRYGVRNKFARNAIITHQINILDDNKLAARIGTRVNKYWINRFDECWIPDYVYPNGLSGVLSNPIGLKNHRFIDPLSRFKILNVKTKRKILVILSGPEPGRSRLENKLLAAIKNLDYLLVRGVVKNKTENTNGRIINYLTAEQLNHEILASEIIICRSGYSSIMDLFQLKKKAILIPTPGQGEQEYLGPYVVNAYQNFIKCIDENNVGIIPDLIKNIHI